MSRVASAQGIKPGWFLLAVALAWTPVDQSLASDAAVESGLSFARVRPLLDNYCCKCHGNSRAKAGVNLAAFTNIVSVYREPGVWTKVINKVEAGEMTPEDNPNPSKAEREGLLSWC